MSGETILNTLKEATKDTVEELGSGMMDAANQKPFKMPSKEELLEMLDTMGLSPEEQAELRAALMDDQPLPLAVGQAWTSQALILISFLFLIMAVLSFIFYRIYKTEVDKEKKKEEKKQQKLLRKKKYKTN